MDYDTILNYFEDAAKTGQWHSLYNPKNPLSHSCISRLQKTISLAGSFKNKRVLDLGCGTGALMPFVINDGGEYIGLDASEKMLDELKIIYPDYTNNKKTRLMFGDINKLELPPNLNIIIGLGFIEYFDNPEELIQRLYDKLSKGGRLILSFPNSCSLNCVSLQFLAPFRYLARIIFKKFTHQLPRRLWNLKNAKKMYIKANFKDIKVVNYNVNIFAYPFTRIVRRLANFWAKRFEYSVLSKHSFFATGFLVSAEK